MKVDETKQTEQANAQKQVLSDLPVNDEQANETNGGFSINFQSIKYDYQLQDDKDKL